MTDHASKPERAVEALIAGKYRIVRLIARGGMGSVYEAVNVRTDGRVALKVLGDEARANPDSLARFAREAKACGRLRSRFVARVLDVDALEDGTPYMVMELLEGRDLAQEAKERGPIPVDEACALVLEVAAGVAEAHAAGIVHRDLKPGNVFLAREGAQRVVKVLDFGISKVKTDAEQEEITRTFSAIGTPAYMSPEQIRSPKDVDSSTDVWAMGVILYRLLAGRVPFSGNAQSVPVAICNDTPDALSSLRNDIPPGVEAIVDAMMRKDRARRPSLSDVAAVLMEHVGSGPDAAIARDAASELAGRDLPEKPAFALPPASAEPTLAATTRQTAQLTTVRTSRRSPTLFAGLAAVVVVGIAAALFATREHPGAHAATASPAESAAPKLSVPATSAPSSAPSAASVVAPPPPSVSASSSVEASPPKLGKPKPHAPAPAASIPARL